MKRTLLPSLAVGLALGCATAATSLAQSVTDRLKEAASGAGNALQQATEAVTQQAREAWNANKAYLSDDPDTYRRAADKKLQELGGEIAQLKQQAASAHDRPYFTTRVQALEQHQQYANRQLTALSPEDIRAGRNGKRRGVDDTLERLEEYLVVAKKEVIDFGAGR